MRSHKVGNIEFKTKKALKEYTKNILEKRGVCQINKDDVDFSFFLDLYLRKLSHQKFAPNIIGFVINTNPINKSRTDNLSCIDINEKKYVFSWNNCCDGIEKDTSDKLKEACRTSIHEQIKQKWISSTECFICSKKKYRLKNLKLTIMGLNFVKYMKIFYGKTN